jgi:hypothetical protein
VALPTVILRGVSFIKESRAPAPCIKVWPEDSMHITVSRMVPVVSVTLSLLLVLASNASAQQQPCSDWYINKVLKEMLNCSPQDIADICSGHRPRPPENATTCVAPGQLAPLTGTPYERFRSPATQSGINLDIHPTYTEQYFETRAQLFCSLLSSGDFTKLLSEVSSPPVVNWTETTADRSRLEVAIMRVGTRGYCPDNITKEPEFERAYVR